jgi:hypothetical protein
MLNNIRKNRMGTVSFDGMFAPQRKAQDFVVYPIKAGDDAVRIMIQSNKRIGYIDMQSGNVDLSPSRAGGSYFHHLALAQRVGKLSTEDLFGLKAHVFATAHGAAGKAENGFIQCDNSGALAVFG